MDQKNDGLIVFSTQGKIMFSSTGEIINNKKQIRKHKINKNIIYLEFEEMKQYSDNDFWTNFLSRCSRNIFPKDYKYMNSVLFYKIKTKKHKSELFIDKNDLEKTLENLKKFLGKRGIGPDNELTELNLNKYDKRETISLWKDIGKHRIELLFRYIKEQQKKFNLSKQETKQLESILRLGVNTEIFNSDNIILQDEHIVTIKYLIWDKNKRIFEIDINNIPIKFQKNEKCKNFENLTLTTYSNEKNNYDKTYSTVDLDKKWEKFLYSMYIKK